MIRSLSNISAPVFGSSRYGTWNLPLPARLRSTVLRALPRPHGCSTYGISSSLSVSRTSAQNGDASYAQSCSGFATATEGLA